MSNTADIKRCHTSIVAQMAYFVNTFYGFSEFLQDYFVRSGGIDLQKPMGNALAGQYGLYWTSYPTSLGVHINDFIFGDSNTTTASTNYPFAGDSLRCLAS